MHLDARVARGYGSAVITHNQMPRVVDDGGCAGLVGAGVDTLTIQEVEHRIGNQALDDLRVLRRVKGLDEGPGRGRGTDVADADLRTHIGEQIIPGRVGLLLEKTGVRR